MDQSSSNPKSKFGFKLFAPQNTVEMENYRILVLFEKDKTNNPELFSFVYNPNSFSASLPTSVFMKTLLVQPLAHFQVHAAWNPAGTNAMLSLIDIYSDGENLTQGNYSSTVFTVNGDGEVQESAPYAFDAQATRLLLPFENACGKNQLLTWRYDPELNKTHQRVQTWEGSSVQ
jgi:hypothetical protein